MFRTKMSETDLPAIVKMEQQKTKKSQMEEYIARKYICKLTNQEVPEDKSLVSLLRDGEILGKICNEL